MGQLIQLDGHEPPGEGFLLICPECDEFVGLLLDKPEGGEFIGIGCTVCDWVELFTGEDGDECSTH